MSATSAMEHLHRFQNPAKICSGTSALEHLPVELGTFDAVRPLVITNRRPGFRGRLRRLLKAFRDSQMTYVVYDRLPETAGLSDLKALAGHFREAGCDALLAVGQGGLMHQAKALRTLAQIDVEDADAVNSLPDPNLLGSPSLAPLFWLPTGPGEGDELGGTLDFGGSTLVHPSLRPQLVCVDTRLLSPGDHDEILNGVLIALVNAVEVCLDSGDNPFAAVYAEAAIKMIVETLTPEGLEEKKAAILMALTNAAVWAGCARDMQPPGLAHRLGRVLAETMPHGAGICMGLCLPAVVNQALERRPRLSAELLHVLGDEALYSSTVPELRQPKCVNLLREGWHALHQTWPDEIPADLQTAGIPREQLAAVARAANPQEPRVAQTCLDNSWTLVPTLQLQALPPESTAADTHADRGVQDAPAELL
jgi:alcohol dehydrogenase